MVYKFRYNSQRRYKNVDNSYHVNQNNLLSERTDNCRPPNRMPIKGYRKATDCNQNCNDTEIFVDNFAQYYGTPQCYNPYVATTTRLVGRNGKRDLNYIRQNQNVLRRRYKTIKQHDEVILFEHAKNDGKTNEFFISPTDLASSKTYEECKTSSGLDKRYTTVVKHNNVQYNQYGGVSQRRRMKRRKYNSILQFQSNICVNGNMCGNYYNTIPNYKSQRPGIVYTDKGCNFYVELPNRDATIIDSYEPSSLDISGSISFNKYINGIPLIDLNNNSLKIDLSLNLSNIYTGCPQYKNIYNLYDLYLYDTGDNVILTLNEPWVDANKRINTKELNLTFLLDYNKINDFFIYSRTSDSDRINFSIDGTYGSDVNKRRFSDYNDGFKNKFYIELGVQDDNKKELFWDYTYSGFNYENNLYYPSEATDDNGNFLLANPVGATQFKVLSDSSDNILEKNQLMWANGGFVAGGDDVGLHSFTNPYDDYTSDKYFLTDISGDNISVLYKEHKNEGDHLGNILKGKYEFWDDTVTNTDISNINHADKYKWLLIKDVKKLKYDSIKITVYDKNNNILKLGIDYLLFIKEIDDSYVKGYNIPDDDQHINGQSGWRACYKKLHIGSQVKNINSNNGGTYVSHVLFGDNYGKLAQYPIISTCFNNNTDIYFRFGLKRESRSIISNISIEYGNNDNVLKTKYTVSYVSDTTGGDGNSKLFYLDFIYISTLSFNNSPNAIEYNNITHNQIFNVEVYKNNVAVDNKIKRVFIPETSGNLVAFEFENNIKSGESYNLTYSRYDASVNTLNFPLSPIQNSNTEVFENYDIHNSSNYLNSFQNFSLNNNVPPIISFIFIVDKYSSDKSNSNVLSIKYNDGVRFKLREGEYDPNYYNNDVFNTIVTKFKIYKKYYDQPDYYPSYSIIKESSESNKTMQIKNYIQEPKSTKEYLTADLSRNQYNALGDNTFYNDGADMFLDYEFTNSDTNGIANVLQTLTRNVVKMPIINNIGYPRIKKAYVDTSNTENIILEFDRDISDNGLDYLKQNINFDISGIYHYTAISTSQLTNNKNNNNNSEDYTSNQLIDKYEIDAYNPKKLKLVLFNGVVNSQIYRINYVNNNNWLSNIITESPNSDSIYDDFNNKTESYFNSLVTRQYYVDDFKLGMGSVARDVDICNNVFSAFITDAIIDPNNGKQIKITVQTPINSGTDISNTELEFVQNTNNTPITDFDISNNNHTALGIDDNSLNHINGSVFINSNTSGNYRVETIDISLNNPVIFGEKILLEYQPNAEIAKRIKIRDHSISDETANGAFIYLNKRKYINLTNNCPPTLNDISLNINDNNDDQFVLTFNHDMKIITSGEHNDDNVYKNTDFSFNIINPYNNSIVTGYNITSDVPKINPSNKKDVIVSFNFDKPLISDYLIDISYVGHNITTLTNYGFKLFGASIVNKVAPIKQNIYINPDNGKQIIVIFNSPVYSYRNDVNMNDDMNDISSNIQHSLFELYSDNGNSIDVDIPIKRTNFYSNDLSGVIITLTNPVVNKEIIDISYASYKYDGSADDNGNDISNTKLTNSKLYNGGAYDIRDFTSISTDNSNNSQHKPNIQTAQVIKSPYKSSGTEINLAYDQLLTITGVNTVGEKFETINAGGDTGVDYKIKSDISFNSGNNNFTIFFKEYDFYDLNKEFDISYNAFDILTNGKNYSIKMNPTFDGGKYKVNITKWDYEISGTQVSDIGIQNHLPELPSGDSYNFYKIGKIRNRVTKNGLELPGNQIFSNFDISDNNGNDLTLGNISDLPTNLGGKYYVFVKEYDDYFDVNNNTITSSQYANNGDGTMSGGQNNESGWKMGHKEFNPGLHVAAQNDNWRGIHRSNILVGPNIFSETTYKIKYSSPNQDVYTEYIFASVENIKSINFVYGNDL